ncbi:MAG: hypothetical protein ACR2J3_01690 [Aridibacter sp.]
MKKNKLSFLVSVSFMLLFAFSAFAQSEFKDSNTEYTFSLPEDAWKMTVKPSTISPNVEYIHNYKKEGHLEIRKLDTPQDSLYSDIIRKEEAGLQFLPGYVAGKEENFRGNYSGKTFNFGYLSSGNPYSGRFYFLKTSPTTVYVIRFRGEKDSLTSIRNQTDSIARTFKLKTDK